jgi:hypothetical protein
VALWTKDGEFEVLKEDLVTSVTPKKESASPGGKKKKQKNKSKKVEKEVESGSDIEEDEDDEDEEGDEEMSE